MNKVLVEVTAPLIDVEFEAWSPINRNIGDIIIFEHIPIKFLNNLICLILYSPDFFSFS